MAAGPAIGGKRGGAIQTVGVLNMLTDLAFNLLIFFVVLASDQPDQKGRPQQVPGSKEEKEMSKEQPQEIAVSITRTTAALNGQVIDQLDKNDKAPAKMALGAKIKELLTNKSKPEERKVIVSHDKDTPYWWWIKVTGQIESAGGIMTLVLESERKREVK